MGTAGLTKRFAWQVGVVIALCSGAVRATLGEAPTLGAESASEPSAQALPLTLWLAPSGLYTVYEVRLETGTVVREYVAQGVLVFAVSWRGPVPPHWAPLLGEHFSTFKKALEAGHEAGQRGAPLRVERDGLVVHTSGRAPHFFGYAYVTDLVPPGINIKDAVQ